MRWMAFFFLSLFGLYLHAQPAKPAPLSIPKIMQGEHFVGFLPEGIRWDASGQHVYFSWNPKLEQQRSDYHAKVDWKNFSRSKIKAVEHSSATASPFGPTQFNDQHQDSYLFTSEAGDLYLYHKKGQEYQQITNTHERESNPHFHQGGQVISFQRGNNLFTLDLKTSALRQLTNFRNGHKKSPRVAPEHEAWLEADQLELFNILRKEKALKEATDETPQAHSAPIYYGDDRLSILGISPDLRYVGYRLSSRTGFKGTNMPKYVTESGYTDDQRARQKVGTPQDSYYSYLYDIERDSSYPLVISDLPGIREKPAYYWEYASEDEEYEATFNRDRATIIHGPFYAPDGQKAVVVVRSMDNKDRWIAEVDLASGRLSTIDRQTDEAWIGGPGISSWNFQAGSIGWIDNQRVYFQSEATGFSHLYVYDFAKKQLTALTNGKFEVLGVQLSKDKETFYIHANAEGPHDQHFYHLSVDGGKMERITTRSGNHQVTLSPDEKHLAIRYSGSNQPWELYLMPNKAGSDMDQVTYSTTPAFNQYTWRKPEVVWFPARDGMYVPARLYRPRDGQSKGPGVIFVHGAGYLQNVHNWWSTYFREYMFHHFLADQGYTVLDIDYRGSAGYGRDWRTAIYRHMGGKDLEDHIDGAKYMVDSLGLSADRLGIYGGSYGGFITLMALFKNPGVFQSGAALRSVTDWAHYNHPYTSNILNTPVEDSLAFKRSSPIYFAEGLQDRLVMLHGMEDSNVQFQDVVRLSQRLIELGKKDWDLAVYPLEGHGFVHPSSWSDEYRRIYELFEATLWDGVDVEKKNHKGTKGAQRE